MEFLPHPCVKISSLHLRMRKIINKQFTEKSIFPLSSLFCAMADMPTVHGQRCTTSHHPTMPDKTTTYGVVATPSHTH